mmetsp:Transcript_39987/g.103227  ORF Transcript_39987/g.103227 Transcript_39987/m.103227 type:complete len:493 (-) Transcript_39987:345-1823(-)
MFEFIKKGVEYLKEKSYVYKSRWRRRRWGAYFKKVLEKTAHIQSDGEVQQKVGCHIMGEYIPPISELEQHLKAEVMSMYWCTYRKDFEAIEDTSLTSDTGWGCMLRTAQMALCEVYSRHVMEEVPLSSSYDVLGRLRNRQIGRLTANHVLLLVCDAPAAPFSLQRMARLGQVEMGIPAGEWYGPAKASHLLKKLNGMFQTGVEQKLYTSKLLNLERRGRLHFLVYMDGVIHEQRVNAIFEQDKRASIAIFIPLRLGLDCVNEVYLKDLISIFSWKQFAGILGGRPKSSYFIIGAKVQADGNPSTASALYLDPHVPQPACVGPFAQRGQGKKGIDVSSYHCDYIQDMPISAIDPSMSLCFFVRNEEEASDLFSKLKEISADDREEVCDDVEKEGVESLGMEEKEEAKKEKENGGEEVVKQKGKKGRKGSRNASAQDGADSEKGERKKGEESKKPTTRKCTPFPIMVTAEIEDISDVASLDEDILSEDDEFVVL